jgi:hypothetical protein
MRRSLLGIGDVHPWPTPLPRRIKIFIAGFYGTVTDALPEGRLREMHAFKHLDLRYSKFGESKAPGAQTVGSVLSSGTPPTYERQDQGDRWMPARGGNVVLYDCTVDADLPVALDNASLILVASDVRGFGHVLWAEMAVRPAALGQTRPGLLSIFGGLVVTKD